MPVCEVDPWRMQYFEALDCPADVNIPTEDGDAYRWYPSYRWVYNKLLIAESQGLACGPHGIEPDAFPVFSKPIYNMRGMGAGSRIIRSAKEYRTAMRPGHMWMELLSGDHVSSDVAVVGGEARWSRHAIGHPLEGGMFDHWVVEAEHRPELESGLGDWVARNLPGYTGMANFETIGGRIIEGHLRFSDQWPDLYGAGWLDALVGLYADGEWNYADDDRRTGYSVVLFGAHGVVYHHPPAELVERLRATPGITSVQVTFHEDRSPAAHSMPPGGFRLAIVNCWELDLGRRARDELALSFWSTQRLARKRGHGADRATTAAAPTGA